MRAKITLKTVQEAAPGAKRYEIHDTELRGLSLRVSPAGTKTWYFNYRLPETTQRRRLRLGEASTLRPGEAREAAKRAAGDVAALGDPQGARAASRSAAKERRSTSLRGFLSDHYEPGHLNLAISSDSMRRM